MTSKQKDNYNKMLKMLRKIAREYMTPKQIEKNAWKAGLEYTEYLEMSYENIQEAAGNCIKKIRRLADEN